jgi:hypothetical protein
MNVTEAVESMKAGNKIRHSCFGDINYCYYSEVDMQIHLSPDDLAVPVTLFYDAVTKAGGGEEDDNWELFDTWKKCQYPRLHIQGPMNFNVHRLLSADEEQNIIDYTEGR